MSTFLVTGASRGIGLELCRQAKARGETVIAACRESTPELDSLGVRVERDVEVTSDRSVADLAKRLAGQRVDVLINNAGVLKVESLDDLDIESIRQQFEINAIGPLRVTRALVGNLGRGSKVVIMTSRMGSLADNGSGGYYGYRMSKAAVNMAGVSLAHDLHDAGIAVALLHPGMVATRMTANHGITPEASVRDLLARVDQLTLESSGSFWHANGEVLPW